MKPFAPATVAIAALLFSGCSASDVINTGGDTKCKDFTAQDEKKQNDEISKMSRTRAALNRTIWKSRQRACRR